MKKTVLLTMLLVAVFFSCNKSKEMQASPAKEEGNSKTAETVSDMAAAARTVAGNVPAHDPSTIVKSGNNYYVFTTGTNIAKASSGNLVNWAYGPAVFTSTPGWIAGYVPGFTNNFWAPDVAWFNNRWNLYYSCSSFGSSRSAIGLVTTGAINSSTRWADRGVVVSSSSNRDVNAIDPSILVDGSNVYMAWGSFSAGIGVIRIDPATGKPTGNRTIVAGAAGGSWEGACLLKEGDFYYLFVNRGSCCKGVNSTYFIVVGRSSSPFGPFVDKNGVNLNNGGGTTVLAKQGNYIGPGHLSRIAGTQKGSVHYYDGADNGNPKLEIVYFSWSGGWPSLSY